MNCGEVFDNIFSNSSISTWLKSYIESEFTPGFFKEFLYTMFNDDAMNVEYKKIYQNIINSYFQNSKVCFENIELINEIDKEIMTGIRMKKDGIDTSRNVITDIIKSSIVLNDKIAKDIGKLFGYLKENSSQMMVSNIDFVSNFTKSLGSMGNVINSVINKSFMDYVTKDVAFRRNFEKKFENFILSESKISETEYNEDDESYRRDIVNNMRKDFTNFAKSLVPTLEKCTTNANLCKDISNSLTELISDAIKSFNVREFSSLYKSLQDFVKQRIINSIHASDIIDNYFKLIEKRLNENNYIIDQNYKNILLQKYNKILMDSDIINEFQAFIVKTLYGQSQIDMFIDAIKQSITINDIKYNLTFNDMVKERMESFIMNASTNAIRTYIEQGNIKGVCYCSKCKNTILYDLDENEDKYSVKCRKCLI